MIRAFISGVNVMRVLFIASGWLNIPIGLAPILVSDWKSDRGVRQRNIRWRGAHKRR